MKLDQDIQDILPRLSYESELSSADTKLSAMIIQEQRISNELARKEIEQSQSLEATIKSLDKKNGSLQSSIYWLTIVAAILAFIQAVAAVISLTPR